MKEIKFDLDDVTIVPAIISNINSRSECNVEYKNKNILPLMAAPMDTVINHDNFTHYINNGIIACLPRGEYNYNSYDYKGNLFISFGLNEVEEQLLLYKSGIKNNQTHIFYNHSHILIDIANGHMKRLENIVKEIKNHFSNIQLMVGNVAHPLTYKNLAMAGADYVRLSIGTGNACTTAANAAINYPMGSLISECYEEKIKGELTTKIVADGGMKGYDDIIKALALGADYVMIGSLFNKTMQSSGFNYLYGFKINYDLAKKLWKWGFPIKKKYRGMSTKAVQRKWGKVKLVTAEGITKYQKVEYTLSQWVENFKDYLKSNMSYSGVDNLEDFIGKAETIYITNNALKRFKK